MRLFVWIMMASLATATVPDIAGGLEDGELTARSARLLTHLVDRVRRQAEGEESTQVTETSGSNRDGRGLGSTLFQLGKLTLSHLLPAASGQQSVTAAPSGGGASTAEKISSSNSLLDNGGDSSGDSGGGGGTRSCTTPEGGRGQCKDLGQCPALLLQLDKLRQSICFQSLFVPGVCCPDTTNNPIAQLINQVASNFNNNNNNNNRPATNSGSTSSSSNSGPIIVEEIPYPTQRPTTRSPTVVTLAPVTNRPQLPFLTPIINAASSVLSQSQSVQSKGRCGQVQTSSFRVVGGELAQPGAWPWMTAIYLNGPKGSEFWCGGTLINERFVMTAAHCTLDGRQKRFKANQYTARFGEYNLRTVDPGESEIFQISEIRVHPQFTGTGFYNDLALFRLEKPVRFTDYIQPICLPSQIQRSEEFVGQVPTIVGWGTTYYGGRESTLLREVQLPVWRNDDCDRAYLQPITDVFICAGYADGGKDACQGDSGGPLMLNQDGAWTQIGIVSFGNKCAEPGFPGVYTRITHFLDWINSNAV